MRVLPSLQNPEYTCFTPIVEVRGRADNRVLEQMRNSNLLLPGSKLAIAHFSPRPTSRRTHSHTPSLTPSLPAACAFPHHSYIPSNPTSHITIQVPTVETCIKVQVPRRTHWGKCAERNYLNKPYKRIALLLAYISRSLYCVVSEREYTNPDRRFDLCTCHHLTTNNRKQQST